MDAVIRTVTKLVGPLKRRVLLMIGRGVLKLIDDAGGIQHAQLVALEGETLDRVERFQEYGFTSVPHPGAEAVLAAAAGDRGHSLVVGVEDRRYRLVGLAGGEVAIYDDLGQKVRLKRNGIHAHSPLNILLRTDGVLRLEGDGVEIHGRTYVQTDVHGKGSRETWTGGTNYDTDSYATGATGAATEHGIDQPSIPSDHPEGA